MNRDRHSKRDLEQVARKVGGNPGAFDDPEPSEESAARKRERLAESSKMRTENQPLSLATQRSLLTLTRQFW